MTPLEKVARAIHESWHKDLAWDECADWHKNAHRGMARAAVEALMEPSEEMVCAGWYAASPEYKSIVHSDDLVVAFKVMLTKALEEK